MFYNVGGDPVILDYLYKMFECICCQTRQAVKTCRASTPVVPGCLGISPIFQREWSPIVYFAKNSKKTHVIEKYFVRNEEGPPLNLPMLVACWHLTFCSVFAISIANSQFITFASKVWQSQSISQKLKFCECKMGSFILSAEELRLILTCDCIG